MAKLRYFALPALILALASCAETETAPPPAAPPVVTLSWLQQIEQQAIDSGVSPATVHEALDHFAPNPRVVTLDQKQPESTITFDAYRRNVISAARIHKGAELMQAYAAQLQAIEARTGVPPQIVVALWAVESSFGQNMGGFETVNALATLAYEGRRADFFRGELFAALHILDLEHMPSAALRGSWAGAMGQCQFMPSTYLKYAVDGDGDGKRDIWNDPIDVIASIANYLAAEGWKSGLAWGRGVEVDGIDSAETGLTRTHALSEWTALGVTGADDLTPSNSDIQASLIQPDGAGGASFLVTDNFRAIMRWNHSTYFAASVGILSDLIKQAAAKSL